MRSSLLFLIHILMTFTASKFDPLTDPSRPKEGSIIKVRRRLWRIEKVEAIEYRRLINPEESLAVGEYDELFFQGHPTRLVQWACWVRKAS